MSLASDYRFHIETLGCPKNKVDSRQMRSVLLQSGFIESSDIDSADIILINSCSFIQEAKEETIETVFNAIELKEKKKKIVGLIGCFSERYSDAISSDIPEIDFTMGTGKYHLIAETLHKLYKIKLINNNITLSKKEFTNEVPYIYLRIAKGCSRNCAFCILPKIRGPHLSFDLNNIQEQLTTAIKLRGACPVEVILVSQDTVSQNLDELEAIISYLSSIEEIKWIRLHYLFPDKRALKLLDLYAKYAKIVSYLDIPFQHISPKILTLMNRPSNTKIFSEIITKAVSIRPDIEIRTSFIIGFPGETEADFEFLQNFIKAQPIQKLALFRYSHEDGTSASENLQDDIDDEVKIERINSLRSLHLETRKNYRNELKGGTSNVIIERIVDKEVEARRPQDSPEIDELVFLEHKDLPIDTKVGDIIPITLYMPMEYDWLGEPIKN